MAYRETEDKLRVRFWSKVDKGESGGCWLWTACTHSFGYGLFAFRGKQKRAHRVAWVFANGEIADGLCVLHKCDTPGCVNPDHLFLGTRADNTQDMMRKRRNAFVVHLGERHGGSKLTWAEVREIRRLFEERGGKLGRGRYVRNGKGITQVELAERFGVSPVLVGKILRGELWAEDLKT